LTQARCMAVVNVQNLARLSVRTVGVLLRFIAHAETPRWFGLGRATERFRCLPHEFLARVLKGLQHVREGRNSGFASTKCDFHRSVGDTYPQSALLAHCRYVRITLALLDCLVGYDVTVVRCRLSGDRPSLHVAIDAVDGSSSFNGPRAKRLIHLGRDL
jgi:hypothetical protein